VCSSDLPELQKRLETLSMNTAPPYRDATPGASSIAAVADPKVLPTGAAQGPASAAVAAPVGQPGDAVAAGEARPKVAPPNFDDLRNLLVPLPAKRFVPPGNDGGKPGNGQAGDAPAGNPS
jgi:hypothetical protein